VEASEAGTVGEEGELSDAEHDAQAAENVEILASYSDEDLLAALTAVLADRPSVLQDLINWAVPGRAYVSARLMLEQRAVGPIKFFNSQKGYGFIECPEVREAFGHDVYLHQAQIGPFEQGSEVSFAVLLSKDRKPQAFDLAPARKDMDVRSLWQTSAKGSGKGSDWMPLAVAAQRGGSSGQKGQRGHVKGKGGGGRKGPSLHDLAHRQECNGWRSGGQGKDYYSASSDNFHGGPSRNSDSHGHNSWGAADSQDSYSSRGGTRGDSDRSSWEGAGYAGKDSWDARGDAWSSSGAGGGWSSDHGGWRASHDARKSNGKSRDSSQGAEQVLDITNRRFEGVVKSFKAQSGFGFITCTELQGQYSNDVFVHHTQLYDFKEGDHVAFTVHLNKEGKPQAYDLSAKRPLGPHGEPPPPPKLPRM